MAMGRWAVVSVAAGLALGCHGRIGDPSEAPATPDQEVPDDATPADPGPEAEPEPPAPFVPVEPLVRRLTRGEYANTVLDVFGVALSAEDRRELPEDRPLEGFVNIASGQTVLPEHVRGYDALAGRVVAALDTAAFVDEHAPCRGPEAECARGFVRSAGALVFRRPLEAAEVDAFTSLFDALSAEGLAFDAAAEGVLEALLQSPGFLYLLERETGTGDARTVGGYEMASRLSYFLWASAPDAALYAAAEGGDLDTPEGIRAQVERMLEETDRVARGLDRFLVDWSRMASIPDDDGLKAELIDAATAYYRTRALEGADLFALFDDGTALLSPDLAQAYGVEPTGAGIRAYDVSGLGGRGGLLGQPGVLAGMTNADGGAIVARGLFLQRQLFCGEPPDPPASLQDAIDEFVAEQPEDASDRQVAETRLMRRECAACHAQFDPLAYGFEHFDYRGRHRMEDEHGNPLRDDGWIPAALAGGEETRYDGFDAYMTALADNDTVRRCWVKRQLEHALGHRLHGEHRRVVDDVTAAMVEGEGSFEAFARLVTTHDAFRVMSIEEP